MGGLSILTSAPLMPHYVCYLCASKGQHEVTIFDELIKRQRDCAVEMKTLLSFRDFADAVLPGVL